MMAIEAAISGLGVILESELLANQELSDGRLIAPFTDCQISRGSNENGTEAASLIVAVSGCA